MSSRDSHEHLSAVGGAIGPPDGVELDWLLLTHDELQYEPIVRWATSAATGAVSSFVGTTRDVFEDKQVLRLEYEAYAPMALSKLREICATMRERWGVHKVAMHHRLGVVGVCEASVVVVVSSAHRRAALDAVAFGIDELKARVPIWKKEVYADGSCWKANAEFKPPTA